MPPTPGQPSTTRLIADASFAVPLTRGLVWFEDVHYNANKFDHQQTNTFSWDNVTGMATATGALLTFTYWAENPQTITYSVNGHAPHQFPWPFGDAPTYISETAAMPVPLAELHAGDNGVRLTTSDANGVSVANVDLILVGAGGLPVAPAPSSAATTPSPAVAQMPPKATTRPARARVCLRSRRSLSLRLHHARGARVTRVQVFVNNQLKLVRAGHNVTRVTIKRLPRTQFVVRIVATDSVGGQTVTTRTYSSCRRRRGTRRAASHARIATFGLRASANCANLLPWPR